MFLYLSKLSNHFKHPKDLADLARNFVYILSFFKILIALYPINQPVCLDSIVIYNLPYSNVPLLPE